MKKILIGVGSAILVILLSFFFLVIFPFLGTKKVLPGVQFDNGKIISVIDGMSQVFILDGGKGSVGLIDAGNSPDGKAIIDALAARGYRPDDVTAIFLTHGHPDHIAAAKIFTGAKIYCLENEVPVAEGRGTNNSPASKIFGAETTGLKVTNMLKDGESLSFGPFKIDVFQVQGHTQGSAVFLISGVLFMGDTCLSTSDGRIKHPVWVFSTDVDEGNRSLKALAGRLVQGKFDVKFIVFSHSGELQGLQPLADFAAGVK